MGMPSCYVHILAPVSKSQELARNQSQLEPSIQALWYRLALFDHHSNNVHLNAPDHARRHAFEIILENCLKPCSHDEHIAIEEETELFTLEQLIFNNTSLFSVPSFAAS
jgi:hypothetical protein